MRLRILVIAAVIACVAGTPSASAQSSKGNPGTSVVMLGTGTPIPDPSRSGPSVAIVVNGKSYIVDCGPGVVRRASAAAEKTGLTALKASNLRVLFITHLHSDHTLGYPDIMLTPAVMHRNAPLEVYGPPGLKAMTDHLLQAYSEDIDLRIHGLEHGEPPGYQINVHEIQPGIIYRDENVTVTAFQVKHGSWKYAYGYRFVTADKTVVISGDTSPAEVVAEQCNHCDVLIHEVYCQRGFDRMGPAGKEYHSHFHTSTRELAEIAQKASPKLLVLYHQLFFGCSNSELADEMKRYYKGPSVSANDLDVF